MSEIIGELEGVYVGKNLGGHEYAASPELVARYGDGTADRLPIYRELAPGLLFHSECFSFLQDWYLPNLIGNLHARQEWELFSPLRVGEKVRSHAFVADRYRKRGRDYVVCETLVFGADGRLANRGRTHQSFLADGAEAAGLVVDKEREKRSDRSFAIADAGGRPVDGEPRKITLEMCRAFSGPSENYHTNREMAQALGFPDVVVQGMMALCFLSGLLTREFGVGWLRGGKMDARLVNVVWAEDVVTPRAKVREEIAVGGGRRAELDVWCEKADGTKVVVGSASALL
jgi:acyl dehydratase